MFFLFNISTDTSAYVEYSSSSDDVEKPQNRSKPAKRRKDDSDSGSDVSYEILPFKTEKENENNKLMLMFE